MSHGSLIWLFEISFRWTKIVGSEIFFDGDIEKSWNLQVMIAFPSHYRFYCENAKRFSILTENVIVLILAYSAESTHSLNQSSHTHPAIQKFSLRFPRRVFFSCPPVSWLSHTLNVREVSRHTFYLAIVAAGQTSEAMRRRHNGCWSRRRSLTTTSLRLVHFAECSLSAGYRNSWQVTNVNSLNLNTIIKVIYRIEGKKCR